MPPAPDRPSPRIVKLTDADWSRLESIARANGLEWGGIPNRSEAVRWLIAREPRPPTPPPARPGSATP